MADQARLGLIGGTFGQPVPQLEAADYTSPPLIRAVGVFDTVSSLGLPLLNSGGAPVFDFSICDTELSNDIGSGFHALAADETRDLFSPTFWATRDGIIQQVFPGCHSDVGGGYPNRGLSDGALDWMLTQLQTVGLDCDRTKLDPPLTANALGIAQDDGATFPFVLTPRSGRGFPDSASASASLITRWSKPTEMLPSSKLTLYKSAGTYADGRPLI